MKTKLVSFDGVTKIYRRQNLCRNLYTKALDSFSLDIYNGEIVGLLGLNGAGKTTIMKLLTGLLFPDSGTISIFGASPDSPAAKREVGFLPELPYFYPGMNAFETLRYYAELSGLSAAEASRASASVIERVGLSPHAEKKVREFSKGMMQRLGIAQAIVHSPGLLILDEPVSGLDPLAIHEIRNLISSLNADGKTIFLSSHSISDLERISSRVVIMVKGKMARTVSRSEWESIPGGLENIFVETVK